MTSGLPCYGPNVKGQQSLPENAGTGLTSAAAPAASPSQPGGASVHNLAAAALAASPIPPAALTPSPSQGDCAHSDT